MPSFSDLDDARRFVMTCVKAYNEAKSETDRANAETAIDLAVSNCIEIALRERPARTPDQGVELYTVVPCDRYGREIISIEAFITEETKKLARFKAHWLESNRSDGAAFPQNRISSKPTRLTSSNWR